MTEHDATEVAYKNGYKDGYMNAYRDGFLKGIEYVMASVIQTCNEELSKIGREDMVIGSDRIRCKKEKWFGFQKEEKEQ